MTKKENKTAEVAVEVVAEFSDVPVKTEKEKLLDLYATLKELNVRSISDLENLIARA